jgi:putative transmembrane protein
MSSRLQGLCYCQNLCRIVDLSMAISVTSGSGVSALPSAGYPPLLQRLASPAWCHPGFAPYWPLLRRLWHMAWKEAGCPEGPLPVFCSPSRATSPGDLPLSTWDTVHWLPFMNRLAAWRGLRAPDGTPLRFVAGSDVGAVDYERSVASGQMPCKLEGAGARHDFHNALVWLRFPRLKSAINQLHCRQADAERRLREASRHDGGDGAAGEVLRYGNEASSQDAGAPKTRMNESAPRNTALCDTGPRDKAVRHEAAHPPARGRGALRDALTLLDENGALWPAADPAWVALLEARQWTALFVDRREALLGGLGPEEDVVQVGCLRPPGAFLGSHAPVIVGHGLLEKLHQPYKSMTAKLLPCADPRGSLDWGTARRLWTLAREGELRPALLQPLPIQGWPGWDPANADPAFYRDEKVFRGPRPACDVK